MAVIQKSNILSWGKYNIDSTPVAPGVYVLRSIPSLNGIVYVGSSDDLRRRLNEHWLSADIPEVLWFDWYQTDTITSAKELERSWIAQYTPKYNTQGVE